MATGVRGSMYYSSEPFYDFSCSNCASEGKHSEGERYCVQCDETLCTSCLIHHNGMAKMRQHELLDKTKMVTRKPPQDLVQLPAEMCTAHPGQVINMFCGQDDLVCCTVCIAEDHRACFGVIYIPTKAKNIKTGQEFKDFNAAIDTMIKNIEALQKGKKVDLDRITAQNQQIIASIKEMRYTINKHLDNLEESANKNLERKFKFHEDQINDTISKLEDELTELEATAAKLKDDQNESQVFVDMKAAKSKQQKCMAILKTVEKSVGKPAIHFDPNNEVFKILDQKSMGILKDEKSFNSVAHHGDFHVKTLDDKKTCYIIGSCQMLNGNVMITDHTNQKVTLLDTSNNVVTDFKLNSRPYDVCRISPTKVAITLIVAKKVQFAEVTDKIILKGSFSVGDCCRGIAYNPGLLYVACGGWKDRGEGPGQVQVYDRAGQLLQTFMKNIHNTDLFTVPYYIAFSECDKKIHISDDDHKIVTMNIDGTEHLKFTRPDMKGPLGICVINNDDIVVCGYGSNNVVLFDNKGQQKAVLLKEKDGIKNPVSVLYDRPNSRLIVSLEDSDKIKVYKLL